MRPTLTLKKKPVPAQADTVTPTAQPVEPVEPVEPAVSVQPAEPAKPVEPAKAAKPSFKEVQAAKAARAEANRLLAQELSARRRAGTERLKPLLDAYWADQAILHDIVCVPPTHLSSP